MSNIDSDDDQTTLIPILMNSNDVQKEFDNAVYEWKLVNKEKIVNMAKNFTENIALKSYKSKVIVNKLTMDVLNNIDEEIRIRYKLLHKYGPVNGFLPIESYKVLRMM